MTDDSKQNAALSAMLFEANKKSTGVAYLLWFFLGAAGGHRFYVGKTGSAIAMLIMFLLGWLLAIFGVGLVLLGIVGIWALVDAFFIPGWLRQINTALAQRIIQQ